MQGELQRGSEGLRSVCDDFRFLNRQLASETNDLATAHSKDFNSIEVHSKKTLNIVDLSGSFNFSDS